MSQIITEDLITVVAIRSRRGNHACAIMIQWDSRVPQTVEDLCIRLQRELKSMINWIVRFPMKINQKNNFSIFWVFIFYFACSKNIACSKANCDICVRYSSHVLSEATHILYTLASKQTDQALFIKIVFRVSNKLVPHHLPVYMFILTLCVSYEIFYIGNRNSPV